jgi:hypothetical protein
VILTSNQDGHQAKNRKKGDEIIPLEMHFFVDSLLLVTQIIEGPNRQTIFWKRTIQ